MLKSALALALVPVGAGACGSTLAHLVPGRDRSSNAPLPIVVRETDSAGIGGIVRTERGQALEETRVMVRGTTIAATTNALGRFRLELPPGVYALRTLRIGYYDRTDSVHVPAGGGLEVEIRLRQNAIKLTEVCTSVAETGEK